MVEQYGTGGVFVQHSVRCHGCGTFADRFWRVEGSNGAGRNVSFPAVDSLEAARAELPALRAEHPELTHWEIEKFEPVTHITVEPVAL